MNTTDMTPGAFHRVIRPALASLATLALIGSLAACSATTTETSSPPTSTPTSAAVDAATGDSNTALVAAAADAFMATLDDNQIATLSYDYSDTAAKTNWSNLPEGMVQRNGLALGGLSAEQKVAALALLEVMLSETGYQHVLDTLAADDFLATNGGGGLDWSSDNYFLTFFGAPSAAAPFGISFGGHHLALNVDYQGHEISMTPEFLGIEPQEFSAADGSTVAAMAMQKSAVFAALSSLSADELAASELASLYDDIAMGPGQDDGSFPSETGVLVSSLTSAQQDLVTEAIRAWVGILDEVVADEIVASYVASYDETTVMWSGSIDPASADAYFRISGPAVWIEYVHQSGIGFAGIHLHTVYRDKTSDYGV